MSPIRSEVVTAPSVTEMGHSHVMKAPENYDSSRAGVVRVISLFSDRLGARLQRCKAVSDLIDQELLGIDQALVAILRRLERLEKTNTSNERVSHVG